MSTASSTQIEPSGARLQAQLRPAVLIVDDNQANLTALDALLSALDVEVVRAASGDDALKQMLARDFAVVLMDIQMPEEDGLSLVTTIRRLDARRGGSLVAIALSGYGSKEDRERSAGAGFDAHLTKPCEKRNLIASLARLTNRRRR